jgi:uncharacterized protein YigE (DUF2233 family)
MRIRSLAVAFLCTLGCREKDDVPIPPHAMNPAASPAVAAPGWRPLAPGLSGLVESRKDAAGVVTTWTVLRVDLGAARLRAREAPEQKLENLGMSGDVNGAVNAGFFEPGGAPSGLLVNDGKQASAWQERGGTGALVVRAGKASIVNGAPTGDGNTDVELAVQCGPRLVEPGGVLGIHAGDGKRAERTAVCVRNGGREVNLVAVRATPGDGPTLFQLAEWLVAPVAKGDATGCDAALNLDGGPSTGLVAHGLPRGEWLTPRGPVPWAIIVTAR